MAESWIKIKASVNEIYKYFKQCPSPLFNIKHYNSRYDGIEHYKGNDDAIISFEALVRYNEIGNRTIERSAPYTLNSLEKTIAEKVKEYKKEGERKVQFESGTYKGIYYSINNDCDENTGGYYIEFYKDLENEFGEIDFDNRLDYMVIHIDIEDEMRNPKKYVEEHIDNLIKKLEKDKEIEMS
ncbi:MAG: hypothetical protein HFJ29_03335 [Clostridia bacterium]|nr:hypothetical protein [Clostridia bacterium]